MQTEITIAVLAGFVTAFNYILCEKRRKKQEEVLIIDFNKNISELKDQNAAIFEKLNFTNDELDKLKFELSNPAEYYEGQKLKDGTVCVKVEIKKRTPVGKFFTNVIYQDDIKYFWNYEFITPKNKNTKGQAK